MSGAPMRMLPKLAALSLVAMAVACGKPPRLVFSASPSNSQAGAPMRAIQVELQNDTGGVDKGAKADVTLSLSGGDAAATLSGTTTVTTVDGVALFSDLVIDEPGTRYTLVASAPKLDNATSTSFYVTPGDPAKMGFVAQPGDADAGGPLAPLVQVELQDVVGNRVPGSGVPVTIELAANPTGATLGGRTTVVTTVGVASFPELTVNLPGDGYVLRASAPGFAPISTVPFKVRIGPPSRMSFIVQPPSSATAGATLSPALQVSVEDLGGNRVSSAINVTLTLGTNPGGGTLSGTVTAPAASGVATFSDLSIDKAASGYRLLAVSGALRPGQSNAFAIVPGAASKLGFSAQPSVDHVGRPVSPVVEVSIQDALGNLVPGASGTVTVALGANPGGATLSGTRTQATTGGVARFSDLSLDRTGTGYTLVASATGYTSGTSRAFDVINPRFVYTDPGTTAKVRLVKNPASTARTLVLDLVAQQAITGYSVGFDLPLDATRAGLGSPALTPGAALNPGSSPMAAAARLPSSGLLAGVLVSGLTQKGAGSGAVTTDTAIPAGSVLYTLRLDMQDSALLGTVFDGAALGSRFRAALKDRTGTDVVSQVEFSLGKLEVQ